MNNVAASIPDLNVDRISECGPAFQASGALVVRNLLPQEYMERFRSNLVTLMQARLQTLGVQTDSQDLDELYRLIHGVGPQHVREVIMLTRDLPVFYECITSPAVQRVVNQLIPSGLFQIVHDVCLFRIDPPDDESRSFDWHQDYPYNVMSQSTVTVWAPITPVTQDMGSLLVVPGSHDQILPVDFWSAPTGAYVGHKTFALSNVEAANFDERSVEVPEVNPGDVLFLHSCVLHRSGKNQSTKARWVCNPRFGDALDRPLLERGWSVVRDKNPQIFTQVHPDLTNRKD